MTESAPALRPKIGVSTQVILQPKWYKRVPSLGVDTLEINRRNSKLYFNQYFLEKVRRYLEGFHLSLHSATTGLFQELESFTRAELETLTAEVDICRFLGARELVFHLDPKTLTRSTKNRLNRILNHARSQEIAMLYESDNPIVADRVCAILDGFPEIGYALDLGHLNNGAGRNVLGCEIQAFLTRIKGRTVYVHANNNDGSSDEHKGLNSGTLDWRQVLDSLDLSQIRKVIIEVSSANYIEETRKALEDYLICF
ncbi:MAG: TIM barrel protein [Deltaproteobacteria bacterium]|nr:TIM barrel protein [Deltaproteobacteria bacterium]